MAFFDCLRDESPVHFCIHYMLRTIVFNKGDFRHPTAPSRVTKLKCNLANAQGDNNNLLPIHYCSTCLALREQSLQARAS